ncbi:hypothetical protein [Coralliovum pocilloporae]|uniref:hypothetical protein n=1 Tax=Coralliovum pocilloporae TaxID=3066369 RepID=UPI003306DA1E
MTFSPDGSTQPVSEADICVSAAIGILRRQNEKNQHPQSFKERRRVSSTSGYVLQRYIEVVGEPFEFFPVSSCDPTPSQIVYPGVNLYFGWNSTGHLQNVGFESLDIYSYRVEKGFMRFKKFDRKWFRDSKRFYNYAYKSDKRHIRFRDFRSSWFKGRYGSLKFLKFLEKNNIKHENYISNYNDLVTMVNENTLCHHGGCDSSSDINDILMNSQLELIYLKEELTNTFTWTKASL